MSNNNNNSNKDLHLTVHHIIPKQLPIVKNPPVEDEDIKIISTRPAASRTFPPIGRNIETPQTHRFSERKPDSNWQYSGQHDSSYYQPQPTTYNHRQQYLHDRRTQKFPSRTDYDR